MVMQQQRGAVCLQQLSATNHMSLQEARTFAGTDGEGVCFGGGGGGAMGREKGGGAAERGSMLAAAVLSSPFVWTDAQGRCKQGGGDDERG